MRREVEVLGDLGNIAEVVASSTKCRIDPE
jgi:hypothetical protein